MNGKMRTRTALVAVATVVASALALEVGVAGPAGAAPAVAAAEPAPPACTVTWGSLPRLDRAAWSEHLTNVRAGRHDCYDRLVIDVAGSAPGYSVRYVPAVTSDGAGFPVPLAGGAFLEIVAQAPSYDENGRPTYWPADWSHLVNVAGYTTFRQVADAGSFEGQTTIGLGVRARLPFRVLQLPGRLVIDVAHHW
jgi:hypothetical protein